MGYPLCLRVKDSGGNTPIPLATPLSLFGGFMSIVVQETDVKFTKIANVLITDQRLSSGAKVLYCYLRSKPTNWKVINSDIINTLQMSQESVAKYFKELISAGWIDRKKEQDEKGQLLGGYIYFLFDLPKKSIQEETPDTEKTLIRENPRYNNNTNTTNKTDLLNNTKTTILPVAKTEQTIGEVKNEIYELFRAIYKKHTGNDYLAKNHEFVNLVKAIKQFDKATIVNKIYLFEAMCVNKNAYFTKRGFADFTIGKLISQWNEIVADKQTFEYKNIFGEEL